MSFTNEEIMRMTDIALQKYHVVQKSGGGGVEVSHFNYGAIESIFSIFAIGTTAKLSVLLDQVYTHIPEELQPQSKSEALIGWSSDAGSIEMIVLQTTGVITEFTNIVGGIQWPE